jgi:hypothetical protein
MTFRLAAVCWACLALVLPTAGPSHGQEVKPFKGPGIQEKLATEIDTKGLTDLMTFKEFLSVLRERCVLKGTDLPIVVNVASYKEENPDTPSPFEAQVLLPDVPATTTAGQALRAAVSQLPAQGVVILRNGVAEVVSRSAGNHEALLRQKVLVRFDKVPLAEVIRQLSEMSGVSIVPDPRLQEKAAMLISADFRGDTSLEAALRMVVNMADLRVVMTDGGAYVTTPSNANLMEKQLRSRKQEMEKEKEAPKKDEPKKAAAGPRRDLASGLRWDGAALQALPPLPTSPRVPAQPGRSRTPTLLVC